MNKGLYAGRKLKNQIFLFFAWAATAFGLGWLAIILGTLIYNGAQGINLTLFLQSTPAPGQPGGLANAIVGTGIMTGIAVVIGTPIGILAGTYLAEYGRYGKFSTVVRSLNDILLSAPSIVLGLFVYQIVVVTTGHFSGLSGALALALIVIPVVLRQTEVMLLLIPNALREATSALGAPPSYVIHKVIWKAAQAGIVTGVLLAIARISGETAPLLFTALNNQFFTWNVNSPMASVQVNIFQMAMSPYAGWHQLAWSGALVITFAVLMLSIIARAIASGERR